MYLIETVLGSVADPRWQRRLSGCAIDLLRLSQWDAQKNRLRRESSGGIPLAIALERGQSLHDGDILFWDAAARLAVVCELALCEVLALDLRGLCALPPLQLAVRALALGHALGNQHWPAVQNDGMVYVPVTVSRDVVSAVLKTHHFDDIPHRFLPGRTVAEHLGPELARRLFGGGEQHEHHHACDHAPAGTPCSRAGEKHRTPCDHAPAGTHHRHSAETRDHDGTGHATEACGHTADTHGHGKGYSGSCGHDVDTHENGETHAHGYGDTDVSGTGAGDQRIRPAHGQGGSLAPQRDRTEAFSGQAADLQDAATHSHKTCAYGHPDHAETRDHDGTGHHAEACGHTAGSSRVSCTTPAAHGAPSSASGTSGSGASS